MEFSVRATLIVLPGLVSFCSFFCLFLGDGDGHALLPCPPEPPRTLCSSCWPDTTCGRENAWGIATETTITHNNKLSARFRPSSQAFFGKIGPFAPCPLTEGLLAIAKSKLGACCSQSWKKISVDKLIKQNESESEPSRVEGTLRGEDLFPDSARGDFSWSESGPPKRSSSRFFLADMSATMAARRRATAAAKEQKDDPDATL